jgi:uncharacterized membrane protein (DUF485 family)
LVDLLVVAWASVLVAKLVAQKVVAWAAYLAILKVAMRVVQTVYERAAW